MGRHGENIRHRSGDDRWEGRYKVYHEGKRKYVYHSVYGHTYAEVKEKLLAQKLTPENPAGTGTAMPFSQAADEWLGYIKEKCKYSTYVKYNTIYQIHLVQVLGDCPLVQVTDRKLQAEIPEHLSENMQKSIYCVANQILRYANNRYPFKVPTLTRTVTHTEKKPVETLSVSEQAKLFHCLYTNMDKYKTAVSLSLYLGLRLGEICALKWSDIDFTNMTMTVSHTVQRLSAPDETAKTNLMESTAKSDCSRRMIPVPCEILDMLDKIRHNQPYIFGGEKPLEPRTMQYQFKRILKEALIADRNFHILRHTFATNCIEKGLDVKSLSEILGHSDVKITLNRYVHPTMATKRLQLEQLLHFYGRLHGQAL